MNRNETLITLSIPVMIRIVLYTLLWCAAVNFLLYPCLINAGGIAGLSQLTAVLVFPHLSSVNLLGILNLMYRLPIFLLTYRAISEEMLQRTVFAVAVQTLALSLLPTVKTPVLPAFLTVISAGISAGCAIRHLRELGCSLEGMTWLELYLTKKFRRYRTGTLRLVLNLGLCIVSGLVFGWKNGVCSLVFIGVSKAVAEYGTVMFEKR